MPCRAVPGLAYKNSNKLIHGFWLKDGLYGLSRVFTLFLDALRYDFVTAEDTPYLHSLSLKGDKLRLRPILGYSDAIRATLFTGTYPDKHGYWIMYRFSPEVSPYKVFRGFRFLDRLPGFFSRGSKFLASKFIGLPIAWGWGYSDMETRNIPFRVIHFFDKTLHRELLNEGVLPVPTIFDVLRGHGMKFNYINSSRVNPVRAVQTVGSDLDLTVVYLHYLDFAAHRYGLWSQKYKETLRVVDRLCRYLVREVEERMGSSVELLVFSDHGMTQPRHYVNISRLVEDPDHGKDYLLFLDSTMIHVWYLNPERMDEVRRVFESLPYGCFINKNEKEKLRIEFSSRLYGDDIFLLNPDYQIFPNYISMLKPKGMHAYHPDYKHQQGIFMFKGETVKKKVVELPDVTATILNLLDLKLPSTFEGERLV